MIEGIGNRPGVVLLLEGSRDANGGWPTRRTP